MANPTEMLQRIDGQMSSVREWVDQTRVERIREQERLRGVKYIKLKLPQSSAPTTVEIDGPPPGFAWNLKLISCTLTGADSVAIYQGGGLGGDTANADLIGYIPPVSSTAPAQPVGIYTWSSDQALIFNGEGLFLATSGAFRFSLVGLRAIQVPAEQIGKVLS